MLTPVDLQQKKFKQGMAHVAVALCDPGDIMLAPNPGYPVFSLGPQLAGANPAYRWRNYRPPYLSLPVRSFYGPGLRRYLPLSPLLVLKI